jgi:ABC-type sugar transport system ATPase subunit
MRGVDRGGAMTRVEALAERMGLRDLLDRSPHQLSGGQQQRVALLRALVTEPELLLFDEPLSNLDARMRVDLRLEIRRIQRRSGITALYVTHDQEEAMALSDRIVVMQAGRIVQIGAPREVYARPATRFVASFLGEANFLSARITGREGSEALLETPLGPIRAPLEDSFRGPELTLVVRPEAVRFGAAGTDAVVRAVAFLGAEARIVVEAGGEPWTVRVDARGALPAEGENVKLEILPDRIHALEA